MPRKSSWKMERASVKRGSKRSKSNKYSGGDTRRSAPAGRSKVWVGGYSRADGTKVAGYWRGLGD